MAKEKSEYEVVSVATETEPRIKNNETGETYNIIEAVNIILNEIKEIKKSVG